MNKHIETHQDKIEEIMTELKTDSSFIFPESVQEKVRTALTSIYQKGVSDTLEKIQSGPAFIVPKSPIH